MKKRAIGSIRREAIPYSIAQKYRRALPLTPALSLRERESPRSRRVRFPKPYFVRTPSVPHSAALSFSLSLRERAGVRGNRSSARSASPESRLRRFG